MEHAIFINKIRAEMVGDKLLRSTSATQSKVSPYCVRGEVKGYRLQIKYTQSWVYVTEDML